MDLDLKPIAEIGQTLGLRGDELIPYGHYKGKVSLEVLKRIGALPMGKYVVVTAINPTPLGEGKTVTTIGLSMGLAKLGRSVVTCLRQPSMGPLFGIKGGAAGGGKAQVGPMEEFNLHLTGDIHAVSLAHNLIAAMIDASLYHGNPLRLDPSSITWSRVVDLNDRALRHVMVGVGSERNGLPRHARFDIAVASELMAIVALASGYKDLRQRIGRVVIGTSQDGGILTAEELKGAGAAAAVLRDALLPTLMQTVEHTPVLVHTGPFANIAHGNSSILADRIGLRLAEYVITESGFGVDCGFEKFCDIKCRTSGLAPNAAVIVCTVRALKMHGGAFHVAPGQPLPPDVERENLDALAKGCVNLEKHLETVRFFGIPAVVTINRFQSDTQQELEVVITRAKAAGAFRAVVSEAWGRGGEGARALAEAVQAACQEPSAFRFLYPSELSMKEKIECLATRVYGAGGVDYTPEAESQIEWIEQHGHGYATLPICMAKTHHSLSHDPLLRGRPTGFRFPIREVRLAAGAGFIIPLAGAIQTMPGLPKISAATRIELDEDGTIRGLF